MDLPAEIHRRLNGRDARLSGARDVIVAKGPLVIMAHGLMSIDPAERKRCWIHSDLGDLTPEQAEESLREWSRAH